MNRTIKFSPLFLIIGLTLVEFGCGRSGDTTVPISDETSAQKPAQASTGKTRAEKDLLGEKEIPADAYYGVQTARGLENFQLSGVEINQYPGFVEAWALVKLAAAQANTDVGAMKPERLAAIEKACKAVLAGKYHDQFQVDWYQGGAGTSTNMNANEVLANIGLELSGHQKGEYQFLEPHDDLNMSQSTNDSYPTAIKVAFVLRNGKLIEELEKLSASFRAKGAAYIDIVKMGRTELQDAVPMTVGPGVLRLCGIAGRRDSVVARRGKIAVRREHGRHCDRHRHQCSEGLCREIRRSICRSSPASPSCPPPTCWRPRGTSRGLSSIPRLSRVLPSSFRRFQVT